MCKLESRLALAGFHSILLRSWSCTATSLPPHGLQVESERPGKYFSEGKSGLNLERWQSLFLDDLDRFSQHINPAEGRLPRNWLKNEPGRRSSLQSSIPEPGKISKNKLASSPSDGKNVRHEPGPFDGERKMKNIFRYTEVPTASPTRTPTKTPTHSPTKAPTKQPTNPPTSAPSLAPAEPQQLTTEAVTTQKPTTQEPTTQEATTQEAITQEVTTQEATTQETTTQEETTQESATQEASTEDVTTQVKTTLQPSESSTTATSPPPSSDVSSVGPILFPSGGNETRINGSSSNAEDSNAFSSSDYSAVIADINVAMKPFLLELTFDLASTESRLHQLNRTDARRLTEFYFTDMVRKYLGSEGDADGENDGGSVRWWFHRTILSIHDYQVKPAGSRGGGSRFLRTSETQSESRFERMLEESENELPTAVIAFQGHAQFRYESITGNGEASANAALASLLPTVESISKAQFHVIKEVANSEIEESSSGLLKLFHARSVDPVLRSVTGATAVYGITSGAIGGDTPGPVDSPFPGGREPSSLQNQEQVRTRGRVGLVVVSVCCAFSAFVFVFYIWYCGHHRKQRFNGENENGDSSDKSSAVKTGADSQNVVVGNVVCNNGGTSFETTQDTVDFESVMGSADSGFQLGAEEMTSCSSITMSMAAQPRRFSKDSFLTDQQRAEISGTTPKFGQPWKIGYEADKNNTKMPVRRSWCP